MIETSYRLNVEALIESRAFGSACVKSFLLTGNGPELSTREIVIVGCQGDDVRDRVVFGCLPAGRLCNECLWWVEDVNKEDI